MQDSTELDGTGAWAEVTSAARTFNWPALTPPCPHLVVMPGSLVWADNQTFQCFLQQYVPTHSTCLFYVFSFPLSIQSWLWVGCSAGRTSISGSLVATHEERPSVFSKGRATLAKSGWIGRRRSLHSFPCGGLPYKRAYHLADNTWI